MTERSDTAPFTTKRMMRGACLAAALGLGLTLSACNAAEEEQGLAPPPEDAAPTDPATAAAPTDPPAATVQ